jgi:hypothetical protein
LQKDRARALLDADYYPPAGKGDVYRIMASGVRTIILIDGVFHATPSIWQRELLDAVAEGIQVLGASSMGALRAAELHDFGMIGYGTIFEWYRDGIIDGDDEVALWHGPEEYEFRPLSEPLVNIRYTLLQAVSEHCLTPRQARELTAYAKQLYYPKRSYRQLLDRSILEGWPKDQVARLENYFLTKSIDLKMVDAIGVLRHCAGLDPDKQGRRRPKGIRSGPPAYGSGGWDYERLLLSGFVNSHGVVIGKQVLDEVYHDLTLVETMLPILSKRRFLLEWARQNAVCCPEAVLTTFTRQWEKEHRILDRNAWLRANGLTGATCAVLLAERALIQWLTIQGEKFFRLKRSFVVDWATQNGISLTSGDPGHSHAQSDAALESWIVKQGPHYFGLDWSLEVALLRELQMSGKVAELIAKMEANDGRSS